MLDGETGTVGVADATVTRAVLSAVGGGDRTAVVDRGRTLGRARFAEEVPAAARGLRRHGVRGGDVGAIHLADACDLALAVHAVGAAGAVPAPLPPDAPADVLAAMMNEAGARFLLTGEETAARSMAAADDSYVRQVFAFGDVPGATPFDRLLEVGAGAGEAPSPDPLRDAALRLTGPREDVTHADRLADLYRLAGAVALAEDDVLVCCGSDVTVRTWVALIDLCLVQGAVFAGVPEPGARDLLEAVLRYEATTVVVDPAKLRALAFDHGTVPTPGLRVLVAPPPPSAATPSTPTGTLPPGASVPSKGVGVPSEGATSEGATSEGATSGARTSGGGPSEGGPSEGRLSGGAMSGGGPFGGVLSAEVARACRVRHGWTVSPLP